MAKGQRGQDGNIDKNGCLGFLPPQKPRQVRTQFPGAIYHVMCRDNRHEPIFEDDDDRHTFIRTLGEAVLRTGWRFHAYVLMGNHFSRGRALRSGFAFD